MGDVIVRLTVNKRTGQYEAKIVKHEGGSTCGDGVDESIIEDLLNAEVPGFGKMAMQEDSGHTCEYFEERQAKQRPHSYRQVDDEDDEDDYRRKDKKLDLGYGV